MPSRVSVRQRADRIAAKREMGMYIYTTLGPFKDDIRRGAISSGSELQQRVYQAGFDGIELSLGMLYEPTGQSLLESIDFGNVTFHSDHNEFSLGSQNPYRRRAAVEQLGDEIAACIDKGVRVLTFHPGYHGKRVSRQQAHENVIAALGEVIRAHTVALDSGNVTLSIENMGASEDKLCRTPEELKQVLDAHPALSLTFDIAHCAYNQSDCDEFLDKLGERVRHVHVSGYRAGLPHKKVALDESEVDMRPVIQRLNRDGMIFCIESNALEVACRSKAVLESLRDS